MKRYLLFASHSYAYSIMRPIEREAWRRGDEVAWFLEDTCPDMLLPEEKRIPTIEEAIAWNPLAVIAPGNWIYPFLPGIKVEVFHGYPINKRAEKKDDHFTLRGWFDIYCTQGPSSTIPFLKLEQQKGYFKVYETGWPKADDTFNPNLPPEPKRQRPCILYGTTFSKGISSVWEMAPVIDRLASEKGWDWIITFHPKLMNDSELLSSYKALEQKHPNVSFRGTNVGPETFRQADALLCDSSSLIVEFLLTGKPAVTYRNTNPGPFLIDVQQLDEVGPALEKALSRPAELMRAIEEYANHHESHRDGRNSARVLDAIDDFAAHYQGKLKPKPLNLVRKLKLRWRLKYFKL
ncbi:MAG: CDP-glycerol--poly(glycerophosphate) glycerophosphotransferase [Bacteroidales bacterium]|nr:CDP-glycerol--poly(glycerophosphate) glycerophosphotransferase [Bacteroidales bacterium]